MTPYPEEEFEQERTFRRRWRYHDPDRRKWLDWIERQLIERGYVWEQMVDLSSSSRGTGSEKVSFRVTEGPRQRIVDLLPAEQAGTWPDSQWQEPSPTPSSQGYIAALDPMANEVRSGMARPKLEAIEALVADAKKTLIRAARDPQPSPELS